ncbi:MAG: DNA repair protein RadA [Cellvibrionaceae bacterium]|nr:DNA repair protein RadA [Cellvibrionaceae bacterium]
MPTLIYIHGFLSSPKSAKAQITHDWLRYHRPEWRFECPYLSSHPAQARAVLESLLDGMPERDVFLLGSSLGGFWATYFAEQRGLPAVLVNPAVSPQRRFQELVGQTLKNYHTAETCLLTVDDLAELEACDTDQLHNPDLYWLMVQKGDETLDYRDAVEKYKGCRQTVEAGGSHAFESYEGWLPDIAGFFEEFLLPDWRQ